MKKRYFGMICMAAVVALMLTGCGGGTQSSSPGTTAVVSEATEGKELVFAANGGISMDPGDGYGGWPCIRNGVGETLFKLDEELQPQLFLLDSYDVSEDHMTWTLNIKEGITFQNGKVMDAEAVKACLERTVGMNERAASDLKIASMEAEGLKLTIQTTESNPVLANSLCDPYACIIDVTAEEDMVSNPIGTGPYMVESYSPDKETDVVAYADYWDGTPKLERIRIVALDKDTMAMALQSGEIDAAYAMPYDGQALFVGNADYNLQTVATSRIYKLYYNYHNEHLANANVRKALNMLVDKKSYGEVVMNGFGAPAVGCFPEDTPYSEGLTATGFDIEGAKTLLAEEGYADTNADGILDKDGNNLSFELVTYSSRAELPLLSAAFQSQCKDIGIEVNVTVSDNVDEILNADQFDISAYAYVTLPTGDPSSYMNFVFGTDGGANFGHFGNAEVDSLLAQLNGEFDQDKRAEITRQIVQLALDEDAYCFMDHLEMSLVTKASVTGLVPYPSDYYQITVDTDITE